MAAHPSAGARFRTALAEESPLQVMGAITSAGFTRVALISETPKGQAALTPAPAATAPAPRR